jgi:hypothetical protein
MRNAKITQLASRGDRLIIALEDEAGENCEVELNSIETVNLLSTIRAALSDVIGSPEAGNYGLPGMKRIQYVESADAIYLRISLTDHVYHEYPVPKGTTLATDLQMFGDRASARNLAKATHQPPEPDISGKKN